MRSFHLLLLLLIPSFGLTANAMEGNRQDCLNAGIDDYLAKPINYQKLATLMEKCVEAVKESSFVYKNGRN